MQPTNGGAIAQVDSQLLFEIAMDLHSGPMDLSGLGRIFQHRQQQIAQALQFDFAGTARPRFGDERVDAATIELGNPKADHAIAAKEHLTDLLATEAHQQGTNGSQANIAALVRSSFHCYTKLLQRRVLSIWLQLWLSQQACSTTLLEFVQGKFCRATTRKFILAIALGSKSRFSQYGQGD